MPVCFERLCQATNAGLVYAYGGYRVVCTEVSVSTNDFVDWGSTVRPDYTAVELMKLPRKERRKILEAAADDALLDYQTDKALTDFEAFGDEDLYDETS